MVARCFGNDLVCAHSIHQIVKPFGAPPHTPSIRKRGSEFGTTRTDPTGPVRARAGRRWRRLPAAWKLRWFRRMGKTSFPWRIS